YGSNAGGRDWRHACEKFRMPVLGILPTPLVGIPASSGGVRAPGRVAARTALEEVVPASGGFLADVQGTQPLQHLGLLHVQPVGELAEGDEPHVAALLLLPGDVLEGLLHGVHVDAAVPLLEVVADEERRPIRLVCPLEARY